MILPGVAGLAAAGYDVCVVGAGPVGIALALELGRRGRSVLVLESGAIEPDAAAQALAEAEVVGSHHVPMAIAVQRRLGGTSNLWGGRCVPLDPVDFLTRALAPGTSWPITAAEALRHLPAACSYAHCGEPVFRAPLDLGPRDGDFTFDRLERWSVAPRFRNAHRKELRESRSVDVRLRAVGTAFDFASDGRLAALHVSGPDGAAAVVKARAFVLAAGGLENARLLLSAQAVDGERFGGDAGPLGRFYMGHVYGTVATVALHDRALDAGLDYYDDGCGSFVRRRFNASLELQQREGLANAALWPEFPPIFDPDHKNGVLSFAYLALSLPAVGRMIVAESIRRNYVGSAAVRRLPHLLNVVRDFPRTATFVPSFVYRRYLARRTMPGFFHRNRSRRYALRYHAEHLPNPQSRVTLTHQRDAAGLPRLRVDLRYSEADALPLIRTHALFADWLTRTGLGTLEWAAPEADRVAHILGQAYDGHHQIGTTRMGHTPAQGVVDKHLQVFGSANLFLAGTSVFPTSGQANPTLTAICLALRLAERIDGQLAGVAVAAAAT